MREHGSIHRTLTGVGTDCSDPSAVSAPSGFTYDAAGNVTNDGSEYYLYDGEGRLCAAAANWTGSWQYTQYIYDAGGTRVAKGTLSSWPTACAAPGSSFTPASLYLLGQGGEQVTELSGTGTWRHTNVWAGDRLDATYDTKGLHFHLSGPLGSRRVQVGAAGGAAGGIEQTCFSLPFGDALSCVIPSGAPATADDATEHHFTGKERDTESGLDYFGARYYASSMGRFQSPDPLNLTEERLLNPSNTLNKYAYAANNPLKFVDPDGEDVTYFYDQGGIAGHAVLFAYNQDTGDSAIESFGPVVHAPIAPGESMFDMSSLHSADDVRSTYASLTIQTSPELAQQVIAYIRAHPDPSTWTAFGPNCSTQCLKILQKFKLANKKASGLRPKLLWNSLKQQYNPNAPANPKNGVDYGKPRTDMFNAFWLSLPQAPKDNSTVTTSQHDNLPCGGAGDPPCPK